FGAGGVPIFLFARQLAERAAKRGEEKQRIVAEASRAAGRFGDPSRAVTVGGQLSAVGEDQHDRRAKPCTTLRADPSAKLVEEAAVAIGGVCPVASGMDAWCAA